MPKLGPPYPIELDAGISNVVIDSPADNELLAYDAASGLWINQTPSEAAIAGTGASTDNAIARFNGTSGAIQNSSATISDTGHINTVTTANNAGITVECQNDASGGVILTLRHNTESPANSDIPSTIILQGKNLGGGYENYGKIRCTLTDNTNGAEAAKLTLSAFTGGASADVMDINGDGTISTKLDDLGTPDDNTDGNATAAHHGLLLKLENTGTKYLRDDGTWQSPAGGGVTDFTDLGDVDNDYTGDGGKYVKVKATEDGLEFAALAGGGDMAAATYDPTAVAADCFDCDNHFDGVTNGVYTLTERTKLATVDSNADVTADNAPQAHKDSHDPQDGGDPLDTANAAEIAGVQAAGTGTAHSFARSDHAHAINHGITDNHILTVDQADAADDEYARFTANGIESRSSAETKSDLGYITDLVDDTSPQLGGTIEVLEHGIKLDDSLSADGTYSGIIEAGTAGTVLAFGDLCYLANADSRWELAKADAAATSAGKLGICVQAAAGGDGAATTMLLWGKVRADTAFPALSVGNPVFISAATAGDVVTTAPSGTTDYVVRILGHGNTSDELFFHPDSTYIELA